MASESTVISPGQYRLLYAVYIAPMKAILPTSFALKTIEACIKRGLIEVRVRHPDGLQSSIIGLTEEGKKEIQQFFFDNHWVMKALYKGGWIKGYHVYNESGIKFRSITNRAFTIMDEMGVVSKIEGTLPHFTMTESGKDVHQKLLR